MHCKIRLLSVLNYVIIIAIVVGVYFVIYLLRAWVISFIESYTFLTWLIMLFIFFYCSIKMLNDDSFNVKGYLVFIGCTIVVACLAITLLLAVDRAWDIETGKDVFPLVKIISGTIVYGFIMKKYFSVIGRTLLKYPPLIKSTLRGLHK